jgi:hypothetical protein
MNTMLKFIPTGIFFLLTVAFGLWLSRTGKPYNGVLFNIHKLIALGVVIFTVMQVNNALKNVEVQALLNLCCSLIRQRRFNERRESGREESVDHPSNRACSAQPLDGCHGLPTQRRIVVIGRVSTILTLGARKLIPST